MLMAYLHMLLSALIYDGTFAAQAWNSERDNRIERKNAKRPPKWTAFLFVEGR